MLIPERTLSTSSRQELESIFKALRANSGKIVDSWAAASSRSAYLRGSELKQPQEVRTDRMKRLLGAILDMASDPNDARAHHSLKAQMRGEHARATGLASIVKKLNLLRDIMLQVVEHDLPDVNKLTARTAIDSVVDRSIEGSAVMKDEFDEMRASIVSCMPGTAISPQNQDMSRFCRNVMDYFDMEFVAIFSYNPQARDLTCLSSSAKGIALTRGTSVLVDSFPIAKEAIEKRVAMSTDNGSRPSGQRKKSMGRLSFEHSVAAPIMAGREATGVMFVGGNSRPVPFTPDEVSLIEDLSALLSWVLENVAVFTRLSLRSKAQKTLIETAAALQQEIESEEIYRIVATRLAEIIPCDEFAFYVVDWGRRMISPAYALGPYASEIMADSDFSVDVGIAGYVSKTRRAEVIWDTDADPRGDYIPGTPKNTTRMLAVPVVGQKDVLGVIELLRYPPAGFTQDDVEIATMFANHASAALENAKLLKELRSAGEQIELHMDLLTHDIANYTTPMMAYLDSVRDRKGLDKDVSKALDKTSDQVEDILKLVEMVRTISRLREGPRGSLRVMDLSKAAKAAIDKYRSRRGCGDAEISLELPQEPVMVQADEMLEDLFTHLFCSLGLSEHGQRTRLSISAEPRTERKVESWWVKVVQPGRVIPNHLKGAVLRMTTVSKSELTSGFGIGLAAARGIVERYSGNMWVSDVSPEDPSKGCVINITMPRAR